MKAAFQVVAGEWLALAAKADLQDGPPKARTMVRSA
jgi:hypothetical protein